MSFPLPPGAPLGRAAPPRSGFLLVLGLLLAFFLLVLVVAPAALQGVGDGFDRAAQRAFGLALRAALGDLADEVGELGRLLAAGLEVKAVAGLREAQIGVHAGNDDAGVDLE